MDDWERGHDKTVTVAHHADEAALNDFRTYNVAPTTELQGVKRKLNTAGPEAESSAPLKRSRRGSDADPTILLASSSK
ncbi:hypothetical protein ABKN59_009947 [Abortiporus biennis]